MIPDTIGSVLAFLGLIAPGLLFELLRERHRPTPEETTFREASRVALTSFVFTLCGFCVVALAAAIRPDAVPNVGEWLRRGDGYVQEHYALIGTTLLGVVLVALAAAIVSDQILTRANRRRARMTSGSVWYHLFDHERPRDAVVWVHARLTDGSKVSGYMRHYTNGEKLDDREISLGGRFLRQGEPNEDEQRIDDRWDAVTFRGDRIQFMRIVYSDRTGTFVRRNGESIREVAQAAPVTVPTQ